MFLHSAEIIGRIVKEVKAPISILAGPQSPSVSELQDLGVARVSYGSGFTKAAITGAKRLAQEILEKGTCNLLKDGVQTPANAYSFARNTAPTPLDFLAVTDHNHVSAGMSLPSYAQGLSQAAAANDLRLALA